MYVSRYSRIFARFFRKLPKAIFYSQIFRELRIVFSGKTPLRKMIENKYFLSVKSNELGI